MERLGKQRDIAVFFTEGEQEVKGWFWSKTVCKEHSPPLPEAPN